MTDIFISKACYHFIHKRFKLYLPEITEGFDEISGYVDAAMCCSSVIELEGEVATPLRFNQAKLNDLIRDLNLSRDL